MAKRKQAKAEKQSTRGKAAAPATSKKRGPRSQALPGMDQVRNTRLDNLCEGMAEHRRVMNAARTDEQGDIVAALQEMQRKKIGVYRHAGIELARVPGAEKLRVRLTKEEGDADAGDLEDGGEFAEERRAAVAAD